MASATHFHEITPKAGSRQNCKLLLGLSAVTARNSPVLDSCKSRNRNETSSQPDCSVRRRLPLSPQSTQQRVWLLLSSIRTGLDACGEIRTHAEGWVIEPRASELGKITQSLINNWSWKFVLRRPRHCRSQDIWQPPQHVGGSCLTAKTGRC